MLFNTASQNDFMPEMKVEEDELIEVVEEIKLLGVMITSDLKWHMNTEYITHKGFARLWMLRRLKQLGASTAELLDVYNKQVRSVLEFGAVVWTAGLTEENRKQIERVQKSAFAIILGRNYQSYENALEILRMETLAKRRESLALKFAKKTAKHDKHKRWFELSETTNTRSINTTYKPAQARTARFMKSAIPYLTSLLNNDT